MRKTYKFYIYHRGDNSTTVKGWLPEGNLEFGHMLEQLANKYSKNLAYLEHVGWSEDVGKGDLAYEGHFSNHREAKNFCQIANRRISEFLKLSL